MASEQTLNLSVNFSHNGRVYRGVTIHPGVDFEKQPDPWGLSREIVVFSSTIDPPQGIFADSVTAVDDNVQGAQGFLELYPSA